tara:strand:+ start:191 stop:361 length:171 start_codon:yes stop_codon:yes gene_type:complete
MPYSNRHEVSAEDMEAMLKSMSGTTKEGYRYKIRINDGKAKITRNKFGDIIKNRRS